MKTILTAIVTICLGGIPVFASTSYEVVGQDSGTVQFDYENGGHQFTVIGANGQTFKTRWSGCGADAVYAYRDSVELISTECIWDAFPSDVISFTTLDWEQRAPKIRESNYVVFMNDAGQFLACKVIDVKSIYYGDSEDILTFEFKVYDTISEVSSEIIRTHNEKRSDYVIDGKNEGIARFDFENNCGQFVIVGTNDQKFTTRW